MVWSAIIHLSSSFGSADGELLVLEILCIAIVVGISNTTAVRHLFIVIISILASSWIVLGGNGLGVRATIVHSSIGSSTSIAVAVGAARLIILSNGDIMFTHSIGLNIKKSVYLCVCGLGILRTILIPIVPTFSVNI